MPSTEERLAVIESQLKEGFRELREDILENRTRCAEDTERLEELINNRVTHERFNPTEKIVFGIVGVILLAVIGALLKLVISG